MSQSRSVYLEDGVHCSDDGFHVWLSLNPEMTEGIALEPSTFRRLLEYVERVESEHGANGYWLGEFSRKRKEVSGE